MKKILVIEDEAPIADALKYTLGKEGFEVLVEYDGCAGYQRFLSDDPDLLVLDIMLPGMDGFEICRKVRGSSNVPILILTARDSDLDELLGLELGADDYISKPFDMRKLIARTRALIRRSSSGPKDDRDRLECGEIVMDLHKHEVRRSGKVVHLTPTEYDILELLLRRPGKVLERETILEHLWDGYYSSSKTLDVHVRHLREKIEADPSDPRYLKTIRGTGYRLERPSEEERDQ